jgi:exoribonuclease II
MITAPFDLRARAHQAMLEAGFRPDFSPQVLEAVQAFKRSTSSGQDAAPDLRALLWSSIDNDTSRDLDQIEYVEVLNDGTWKLLIGIADVDCAVPKDGAADAQAAFETTSVYTGVSTFPMLPVELSTDMTSLVAAQDRRAVVIELHVLPSGDVSRHDVYPALVRNRAKLAYSSTGAWLEGRGPIPAAVVAAPGMEVQLRTQLDLSIRLRALRKSQGALTFGSIEPVPVMDDGRVKDLEVTPHNVAQDIIESFMVAANVAMARYLADQGALALRRVVRTPRRWDRIQSIAAQFGVRLPAEPDSRALCEFLDQRKSADPLHFPDLSLSIIKLLGPGEYMVQRGGSAAEGHFGLAVHDYTHSTAPNRRFADLVTQRLLKNAAAGRPGPYEETELAKIAAHCTEREDAARKVERLMRKIIAASALSQRIGEVFDGIITGASPKGTYVRLLNFPAEGRVVRSAEGIDVGDRVRVRLLSVDTSKGFVDFERITA